MPKRRGNKIRDNLSILLTLLKVFLLSWALPSALGLFGSVAPPLAMVGRVLESLVTLGA